MKSYKNIFIDGFLAGAKCFIFLKKIIGALLAASTRLCYILLKLLLKWPAFFAYKAFSRFHYRMAKAGIRIKNPLLYVFSSKTIVSLILIGAGMLIFLFNITLDITEASILAPKNILVSFIIPEDESAIEEMTAPPPGVTEYAPLSGIRADTPQNSGVPSSSFTPPGGIALNSGALIKPTIPSSSVEEASALPNALRTYIVQSGDTAGLIASRFNLSLNTVLWANDLSATSRLTVGQKITILPVDGVLHRIKKGDTIGHIATLYSTDVDDILAFNNLPPNGNISINDALIIPNGIMKVPIPKQASPSLLGRLKKILSPSKQTIPERIGSALRFLWPTTASRITQYFSWRHTGVDIAGPPSNKILAASSGVVIISGWQRGYGQTIVIDHGNGYRTRYGHASKLFVRAGEQVQRGEVIAMVGSTGRSTGPHLHFEVVRNGTRINPLQYIR